ncbi:MAG: hypothetical protein MAG451_01819 [Anaerolineales bacterium]|nr:hypothetical protein [Anaerolineales bacterium]
MQLVHDGSQQTVDDGVIEARLGLVGHRQQFGVQGVEGARLHVDGAASSGEPAAEGSSLGSVRHNDPDGRQRVVAANLLDAFDTELGLAGGGRREEKLDVHRELRDWLTFPLPVMSSRE